MVDQYLILSEPLSQEEVPNRSGHFGKKHALLCLLIGLGCGCIWALSQDGQQAMDPANAMTMGLQPMQQPRTWNYGQPVQSRNFRNFMQPVQASKSPESPVAGLLEAPTKDGEIDILMPVTKRQMMAAAATAASTLPFAANAVNTAVDPSVEEELRAMAGIKKEVKAQKFKSFLADAPAPPATKDKIDLKELNKPKPKSAKPAEAPAEPGAAPSLPSLPSFSIPSLPGLPAGDDDFWKGLR